MHCSAAELCELLEAMEFIARGADFRDDLP
jgi:hypothetical protein